MIGKCSEITALIKKKNVRYSQWQLTGYKDHGPIKLNCAVVELYIAVNGGYIEQ